MPALVALTMSGPSFVDALAAAWDAGDAVLPVDPRWPAAARRRLLDTMRPAVEVDRAGGRRVLEGAIPTDEGDALVVATSGTTGEPKGVVLTHGAVAAHARAASARLGVEPASDHWLACLPLAHAGGIGVVTRALLTGTPLTVHEHFDPAAVEAAATAGATLVSLVGTALARVDADAFRVVLLGGAAPPASVPTNVVVTYGLTETGGGVVYDGVPLDGTEVRTDADGGIELRGPTLLRAYRDGTDPRTAEGWLPTGDVGHLDAGRLVVDGRRDEVIVTGGHKVWPDPVERALACHPAVAEVAVAGRPDPEWGERVVAFVVPVAGVAAPALDDVRAIAKEHLPAFAAPRELVLVERLPRNAAGKIRRSALPAGQGVRSRG